MRLELILPQVNPAESDRDFTGCLLSTEHPGKSRASGSIRGSSSFWL